MDKNTLNGLLLMAAVIFLFMWLNKPSDEQIKAQREAQEAAQQAQQARQAKPLTAITKADVADLAAIVKQHGAPEADNPQTLRLDNDVVDLTLAPGDSLVSGTVKVGSQQVDVRSILLGDFAGLTPEQAEMRRAALRAAMATYQRYKSFAPFFYGTNEKTELENENLRVTFASKGGVVEKVVLKNYKTETTKPATDIVLFDASTAGYSFTFQTSEQHIYTDSLYFRTTEVTDTSVVMSLPLADGIYWRLRYTLVPGEFIVKMEMEQQGIEAVIPASTTVMGFDWKQRLGRNELGRTFEERNSAIFYKYVSESPSDLDANKPKTEKLSGRIKWVAFKNQFFSSVIIARKAFSSADLSSTPLKEQNFVKDFSMQSTLSYSIADAQPAAFDFYFGPNDYPLLTSLDKKIGGDEGLSLNKLVPLGWWWVRWINTLFTIPVFTFLSKYISNYGIIILILTILVKLILFPFTYKSYMSQAKMRVLQPEIKEINDKYPGQENAMKRQQETMALYSRAGASPFSGCLPMMLQMPVLIALFWFFPSSIELRGQSFLWAHDLSAPDSICTLPFTIPWYGNHVSLFCLLMTVTNIIYTRINMQSQPSSAAMPGMKWMMYLMPVMFLFFFNDYASGLSYYYFLSLLITIIQTYVCRAIIDEKKVRAQMLENAKNPKKKKGGFMARLEEMQKKQEAMMREQAKQNAKRRR